MRTESAVLANDNIFAPPAIDDDTSLLIGDACNELEATRRVHITCEASIRSVGALCILEAFAGMLVVLMNLSSFGVNGALSAAILVQALIFLTGLLIRQLDPRGRVLFTIAYVFAAVSALLGVLTVGYFFEAMLGVIMVMVIPTAILMVLWSSKADMVMGERYRQVVIPATPHIFYRPPVQLMVALFLVFTFVFIVMVVSVAKGSRLHVDQWRTFYPDSLHYVSKTELGALRSSIDCHNDEW